jgi:hypothetical protein
MCIYLGRKLLCDLYDNHPIVHYFNSQNIFTYFVFHFGSNNKSIKLTKCFNVCFFKKRRIQNYFRCLLQSYRLYHDVLVLQKKSSLKSSLTLFVDTVSTGNILLVDTKKDPASSVADTKKDPATWEEVRRRYCLVLVHMGSTLPTSDFKLLLLILWNLKR